MEIPKVELISYQNDPVISGWWFCNKKSENEGLKKENEKLKELNNEHKDLIDTILHTVEKLKLSMPKLVQNYSTDAEKKINGSFKDGLRRIKKNKLIYGSLSDTPNFSTMENEETDIERSVNAFSKTNDDVKKILSEEESDLERNIVGSFTNSQKFWKSIPQALDIKKKWDSEQNFYKIFQVEFVKNTVELKKRVNKKYHQMQLDLHPDKFANLDIKETDEKLLEEVQQIINKGKSILTDDTKRAEYDKLLHKKEVPDHGLLGIFLT